MARPRGGGLACHAGHMTAAWVVRTGKYGERDEWSLESGVIGGGWSEFGDLSAYSTRESVARLVDEALPALSTNAKAAYTGQLWALRARIEPGDLMVLPLKTSNREIAFGRALSGYEYRAEEEDPSRRHVVRVDWQQERVSRAAIKQDLLYTLNSALTVFAPSRGRAVERLVQIALTGRDPGQLGLDTPAGSAPSSLPEEVDEPEVATNIAESARDQILTHISETFKGHRLTELVSALLEADGFLCQPSTGGADGGVDVVAGRGLLGMDPPRLIVQVKSGGQVGDPVFRDLLGAMQHVGNADQGLLVAWDGVSNEVKHSLRRERFRVRLWQSEDVVDAVLRVYERLPDDIQADLPLQRVWMLAD